MHRFDSKRPSQIAAFLCAALLATCGGDDESVPAACMEGPAAVRSALDEAPGQVRLDGTRLSGCLVEGASGGELQAVGSSFVQAAAALAPAARRNPEGRAAMELGYLVGAARRGGSTQGVHAELLRRLEQELGGLDTRSGAFRRGERAGRSGG
jgi:ABC-type phosphate transport system substrate-binding protein